MNGMLGNDSVMQSYAGKGTTRANEMNFGMNRAPGAGSITRPTKSVVQRATTLLWLPPFNSSYELVFGITISQLPY